MKGYYGKYHIYLASCVPEGGIYHYVLEDGTLKFCEKTDCDSPMYLLPEGDRLHVLLNQPEGLSEESGLLSYGILEDGSLGDPSPMVSTKGRVACHLCSYKDKIYVANYISGNWFSTAGGDRKLSGSGPDLPRQAGPHTHYIHPAPDGTCLLGVDLGVDAICSLDEDLNVLATASPEPGQGPRHLAYSEDGQYVFCANELGSTVSVFRYESQTLIHRETVSTLKEPFEGRNYPAAIRVKGDYVYVSNRGHDSIACFQWDGSHLELCSLTPCGGAYPRDILLVGNYLFCANQKGNCVTAFRVDGPNLTPALEKIDMPEALCVAALAE